MTPADVLENHPTPPMVVDWEPVAIEREVEVEFEVEDDPAMGDEAMGNEAMGDEEHEDMDDEECEGVFQDKDADEDVVEISGDETVIPELDTLDALGDDLQQAEKTNAERPLIDNGHGLKPARTFRYTEKHSHSRAGHIVAQNNHRDTAYASSLYDESGEGPSCWAPFTSRLDWEVAKWAKLRGTGATAVSELLSIDGVCSSSLIQNSQMTDLFFINS